MPVTRPELPYSSRRRPPRSAGTLPATPPPPTLVPGGRYAKGPTTAPALISACLANRLGDYGPLADGGVAEQASRADPGSCRDRGVALQLGARADLDITAEAHAGVDPGRRRIDDRHTRTHPVAEQPFVQNLPRPRQLGAVVNTKDLFSVFQGNGRHPVTFSAQDGHHVGEVLLALGVVGGHPLDRVAEQVRLERVDPRVDLIDGALLRGGVRLFDDLHKVTGRVADDPAVATGIGDPGGQHGGRSLPGLVLADQRGQGRAAQQGRVRVGHHDRAVIQPDRLDRGAHRVPGTALVVLDHRDRVGRMLGQVRGDLVAPVADHHDEPGWARLPGGDQNVTQQGCAADRVQHLGGLGLHPRTLARGEDDYCSWTARAHLRAPRSLLPGYRIPLPGRDSGHAIRSSYVLAGPGLPANQGFPADPGFLAGPRFTRPTTAGYRLASARVTDWAG